MEFIIFIVIYLIWTILVFHLEPPEASQCGGLASQCGGLASSLNGSAPAIFEPAVNHDRVTA